MACIQCHGSVCEGSRAHGALARVVRVRGVHKGSQLDPQTDVLLRQHLQHVPDRIAQRALGGDNVRVDLIRIDERLIRLVRATNGIT